MNKNSSISQQNSFTITLSLQQYPTTTLRNIELSLQQYNSFEQTSFKKASETIQELHVM